MGAPDPGADIAAQYRPDWEAVAAAIRDRMDELDMTQAELAQRAGVALMTVRELQRNLRPRRRNPRTLAAVSEALGWPPGHLAAVSSGDPGSGADDARAEVAALAARLDEVVARLDAIERRLGASDPGP